MFGSLRLFLALLVVAAHCELSHQINLGVSAVIVFFLISGFVMTATIRRYYNSAGSYGDFLLDRAGRIFPQYLFWLALSLGWQLIFANKPHNLGVQSIAENVLLLPLMYTVYDWKPILTGIVYVSQTWSLSLEWHFYMLLPLALLIPKAKWGIFGGSFLVFVLASLNLINSYVFGYHLLPGVFFIFLIGSFIFDETKDLAHQPKKVLGSMVAIVAVGILANAMMTLDHEWTREVLIGLLAGIPLLLLLSKLPSNRFDNAMGNLSFGVFLNHNLVLSVIYKLRLLQSHWAIFAWAAGVAIPLAMLSYWYVERPFNRLRRRRRERYLATI